MGALGTFTRGHVIYGPFPFSIRTGGVVAGKNRPALVLARTDEGDLIVCQITSRDQTDNRWAVALADTDFERGRLQRESSIRIDKLFTIDRDAPVNPVGMLNGRKQTEVINTLIDLLAAK